MIRVCGDFWELVLHIDEEAREHCHRFSVHGTTKFWELHNINNSKQVKFVLICETSNLLLEGAADHKWRHLKFEDII